MTPFLPTGQVVRILETPESRVHEAVRRGHVDPPPVVIAGRRLWEPAQVRQVAEHLGLLTEEVERLLGEEDTHVPQ